MDHADKLYELNDHKNSLDILADRINRALAVANMIVATAPRLDTDGVSESLDALEETCEELHHAKEHAMDARTWIQRAIKELEKDRKCHTMY